MRAPPSKARAAFFGAHRGPASFTKKKTLKLERSMSCAVYLNCSETTNGDKESSHTL